METKSLAPFFSVILGLTLFSCQLPKAPPMPDPIYSVATPSYEQRMAMQSKLEGHPDFVKLLENKRYRILEFIAIQSDEKGSITSNTDFTPKWQASIYDYSDEQGYFLKLSADVQKIQIDTISDMFFTNDEEIEIASQQLINYLKQNKTEIKLTSISQAMPPVIRTQKSNRSLTFWVSTEQGQRQQNDLYAVNLAQEVAFIENINHTFGNLNLTQNCGPPNQDSQTEMGGELLVLIPDPLGSSTNLWEFTIVSPSCSSGEQISDAFPTTGGSGVELKNVYYRGVSVLKRAHAPKLNVQYEGTCGSSPSGYLYCSGNDDGQFSGYNDGVKFEAAFVAEGSVIEDNPGFMNCTSLPTTIFDEENDAGNFKGVALYKNTANNSFLVVSELQFGHYRYISEWTFYPSGLIVPRFKFGAISNSCTCTSHVHHVYWRFDFDVESPINSVFESHATNVNNWTSGPVFTQEEIRYRTYPHMKWTIKGQSDKEVELIAGQHDGDGTDDIWARGDVFIAKYVPNAFNAWFENNGTWTMTFNDCNLINGENIAGEDIVIWYRGGSLHDETAVDQSDQYHIVGPSIRCSWTPWRRAPLPASEQNDHL